jgi:C1A family cysteine protease
MMGASQLRPIAVLLALVLIVSVAAARAEKSEDEQLAEIQKMIAEKGYHWTAGKTSVSGLSDEEKMRLCGYVQPPEWMLADIPVFYAPDSAVTDTRFDWRDYGCVTPSKDQASCGSCWAFAAVGELESHMLIHDGRYEDLSEQQILSCINTDGSCGGGWMWEAYNVFLAQGAVTEACMPYEAVDTIPCTEWDCTHLARITGYVTVANSVNDIKHAVLKGSVSTTFQALGDFFFYTGGCYENDSGVSRINHAVTIIGWDDEMCDGQGAWICKNSWGENWGENGFFYIRYGDLMIGSNSMQIIYTPSPVRIHVESPNGGEGYVAGGECQVTWTTDRELPDSIRIYLSTNGGALYGQMVASGLENTGTFDWKLPMVPTEDAKLILWAYLSGGTGGLDTSDDIFSIVEDLEAPVVTVTHPNGGELYSAGDTLDIEWVASDNACVESIDILCSANGGLAYTAIATGEENDAIYKWVVPSSFGDSCMVKIVAYDPSLLTGEDASDAPFYISEVSTDASGGVPRYTNRLEQNYPNPFNGTTTIAYSVAERSEVYVRIYDTAGRLVKVVEHTTREPGTYTAVWRGKDAAGRDVASGVYFCSITTGSFRDSRKIVYLR